MKDMENEILNLSNDVDKEMNDFKNISIKFKNSFRKSEVYKNLFLLGVSIFLFQFIPFFAIGLTIISSCGLVINVLEIIGLVYSANIYGNLSLLSDYIKRIENDLDGHIYEAYLLNDYLKNEKLGLKKLKQINEYLSKFDKDKPNSCFNEVGIKYNYQPYYMIEEDKKLQIDDKCKKEDNDDIRVIVDTSLVDKYLECSLTDNQSNVSNLVLKPDVFNKDKKVINKNGDYTHIEISIGKVKILTIDKYK